MRHRLALIGLGRWGRQYLRIAERLDVTVVCHTRHGDGDARWLAEHHPAARHTTSLREALDERPDGVAIVTPRRTHTALTLECLRRDLHVLVEKPAVTDLADLERTHAEARARGLVLRTGYTHRFDESLRGLGAMARGAAAPTWRFAWANPAPGTGVTELVWEYFPHAFSIAGLLGEVDADRMSAAPFRAAESASGAAVVEVELPMQNGRGYLKISSAADSRHKSILLYDGDEVIAEWSDRRLLDVRRNHRSVACEEPLLCQIRGFLEATASPGYDASGYVSDRLVTGLLVELSKKAQQAGFVESGLDK